MKTCLPQNKRSRKTPKINDCDLLTASFLRFHLSILCFVMILLPTLSLLFDLN